jgi:2-keto-3-deoxy-L-rhamnonate aldolase RhmA
MCCAMANAGYDFTWIEMQHSALTYEDVVAHVVCVQGGDGHAVHPGAGCH